MATHRTTSVCRIVQADAVSMSNVLALVRACNLPPEGLVEHMSSTLVAIQDEAVVGSSALELYGDAALLRSVAVASSHRGMGLGRRLVEAALKLARERGVQRVFLLTETADSFFSRFFAFRPTARDAVDAVVRQSVEFKGICPCSARAMILDLSSALGSTSNGVTPMSNTIVDAVRSKYGAVAASSLSSKHDGVRAVAEAFGYTPEELASIPAEANMGLSCGNPTAFASLKPGEIVVDLGSGGGLDVFLAAQKVGPTGKAIGIDMTPEMIERARAGAGIAGLKNVDFHLATIDKLPLPDSSVDCVISNCVINLAPDKPAVFREIARVLKPGGRLAVSDIALKKPLPAELAQNVMAYIGCIAGAILIDDYRRGLLEAGFAAVQVVDSGKDLSAYAEIENQAGCCSPPKPKSGGCGCSPAAEAEGHTPLDRRFLDLLTRHNVNDFAASCKVYAVKPNT